MASSGESSDEDDHFWCSFAAGVDVAMLEREEKARKERTVWS